MCLKKFCQVDISLALKNVFEIWGGGGEIKQHCGGIEEYW